MRLASGRRFRSHAGVPPAFNTMTVHVYHTHDYARLFLAISRDCVVMFNTLRMPRFIMRVGRRLPAAHEMDVNTNGRRLMVTKRRGRRRSCADRTRERNLCADKDYCLRSLGAMIIFEYGWAIRVGGAVLVKNAEQPTVGVEPTTPALRKPCSTIELRRRRSVREQNG